MSEAADTEVSLSASTHRWWMLAGMWLVYACFGMVMLSLAPLVDEVTTDLGLSFTEMGIALGVWSAVYFFVAVPAGAALDRFGLRRSLLVGTLLVALSSLLRGMSDNLLELSLSVAVFGLGGPLLSVGAPKLISRWFSPEQRGTAMGIYMSGPALGAMFALGATDSLVMPLLDNDWRAVAAAYALVTVLAAGVWWLIASHSASRAVEREPVAAFDPTVFVRLLAIPQVRIVLAMAVGSFILAHALNNWLPEILRSRGYTEVEAGFWATLPVAVGLVGTILIPRFATPGRRLAILIALFALAGVSIVWLAATSPPAIVLGLATLGVARSAMWPVVMLILMGLRDVDHSNMGAAGGLFFALGELGGVVGPIMLGWMAEVSGGFTLPLWVLAALCAAMCVLALRLRAVRDR